MKKKGRGKESKVEWDFTEQEYNLLSSCTAILTYDFYSQAQQSTMAVWTPAIICSWEERGKKKGL